MDEAAQSRKAASRFLLAFFVQNVPKTGHMGNAGCCIIIIIGWMIDGNKIGASMIDIERLRRDLLNDDYGAFFGGGFGGALMESMDIRKASPEELIRIAQRKGVDISRYEVQ